MDSVSWKTEPPPKPPDWWAKAPEALKNAVRYNFARYVGYLTDYIVKNKLSGQVLGKYTGAYSAIGGRAMFARGNPRWEKRPGLLAATVKTKSRVDPNTMEGTIAETRYGRAWEYGFSRKAYIVAAKHLTRDGGFGYLQWFSGGAWRYAQQVSIPAAQFAERPHIRPSVAETVKQFRSMVARPLAYLFTGQYDKIRQVGVRQVGGR